MQPVLHTKRLTLRGPELRDAPAFAAHMAEYDVAKMTGSVPHPYPLPAADFWILQTRARIRRGLGHSYMLVTKSGNVVGNVSLFRKTERDDFEIGYHVGKPWWGLGYATEALRAVINAARQAGHARLTAGVFDENTASQALLAKFGFVSQGPDTHYCMARARRLIGQNYALDLTQAIEPNSKSLVRHAI